MRLPFCRGWRGALALVWMIFAAAAPDAPALRVHCLGDSITEGWTQAPPFGYRAPLYSLLTNAGFTVEYVGTQTGYHTNVSSDPSALPASQRSHDGYPGARIANIDLAITNILAQIADPDVILLLIGTNNSNPPIQQNGAADQLEALIARIATNRPNARIIVGNLLPRGDSANIWINKTFNPAVPSIVARQAALGRKVYFTDMNSTVPLADLPDGLHPNLNGYTKMATNWLAAISNLFALPTVSTQPESGVSSTGFTLNAKLTEDRGAACTVRFYWGTQECGDNTGPTKWANTNTVPGDFTVGQNPSLPLAGLLRNATYWYRVTASNSYGEGWAGSSEQAATLNGTLTFTSRGSGNWSAGSTWDQGVNVPSLAGDAVVVDAGDLVVLDAAGAGAVAALTVGVDAAVNRSLPAGVLTVAGTCTSGQGGQIPLRAGDVIGKLSGDNGGNFSFAQATGQTTGFTVSSSLAADVSLGAGSVIRLTFNGEMTGGLHWGMRWAGDHVTALRNFKTAGNLVIAGLPPSVTFDPNTHIFYSAGDNYTYVGYTITTFSGTVFKLY